MLQVRWTKNALHSQQKILKYWIKHNSSNVYSKKLRKEIKTKEKLICKNPLMGSTLEFENIKCVLIDKNYSLYYRVKTDFIEVIAFWDNRRNPDYLEL